MHKKIKIRSEIKNLRIVEKIVDDISAEMGIDSNYYGKIMVSTMEAVNNAIVHGNKSDINKEVEIEFEYKGMDLKVSVEDEGNGFNYNEIPDPTLPENIEKLTGRGVFLMRKLADEVRFNEKGNKVTLIFNKVK
ncbi:MAG TPA: ATP-binding protein [Bacteroidales bacterium]|nr:ATP-binding protein [Bacteroidales bacterium]HOK73984.1 ATP-binding protein [Bacteroidales bacterium]HOM40855.1 ATP-binding protein [Bacteroidales bacterium]HPP91807.1 ATP-binding protein [Bacteroidales bacterium]HQK70696.1 ATP-binding protein [Bacteroidales bacterium]